MLATFPFAHLAPPLPPPPPPAVRFAPPALASDAFPASGWSYPASSARTSPDPFALRDGLNDPPSRGTAEAAVRDSSDRYSRVVPAGAVPSDVVDPYDVVGVGAALTQEEGGGRITVAAPPRMGSSADRAGLGYGDAVTAVNGVPTEGRTSMDVVDQIFDDMDAETVTMTILPADGGDPREVTLERDFSGVPKPLGYKLSEVREDGTRVGYVQIRRFYSTEYTALRRALVDLRGQGANALVLDLRGNTGGVLQGALGSASLFLDGGVAFYSVDERSWAVTPYRTWNGKILVGPSVPVVVWVDAKSASAAEIFTAALRDNCRALVMGERTYGKGLIQAVVGLEDGGRLVVTVARYLTPEGKPIDGLGITPDLPGRGIVPPWFVLGKRTDTSKVDFREASERLGSLCSSGDDVG